MGVILSVLGHIDAFDPPYFGAETDGNMQRLLDLEQQEEEAEEEEEEEEKSQTVEPRKAAARA